MITIVLSIPAVICYIIFLATYLPQAKYKNGMLFTIKLSERWVGDPEILEIQTRFRRHFILVSISMLLAYIPIIALYSLTGYQIIYYLLWLFVLIIMIVFPFRRAFRDTLSFKRERAQVAIKLGEADDIDLSDEDEYWGNGFTYHNPHDKRLMVPKRVGIGETVNTGTKAGKLIIGGAILLAVGSIVAVSFLLIRSEITSPSLAITADQHIHIHYPMYSYQFPIDKIVDITLVDTVPGGVRLNGEATNQHARGHFRLKDEGRARLYIFKNNPPYIRIQLDELIIYFNENEPATTIERFKQLQRSISLPAHSSP